MAGDLLELIETDDNLRVYRGPKTNYSITRDGATGFWSVHTSSGALPQSLTGSFTGNSLAVEAIRHYLKLQKAEEDRLAALPPKVEKVKLTPRIQPK